MNGPQMRALIERHLDDLADIASLRAMAADENEPPAKRAACAEQANGILDDLAAAMAAQIGTRELVSA